MGEQRRRPITATAAPIVSAPPVGPASSGGTFAPGRPLRLLDVFSGAGGCAVGYHRAGFADITGVDLSPQPRYPFRFIQADALEFLASVKLGDFDLIAASPPCQHYSWGVKCNGNPSDHPDLLPVVREALQRIGTPYVIENVVGAPMGHFVTLCGEMFGLGVIRHRRFETSNLIFQPEHRPHRGSVPDGTYVTVAGHGGDSKDFTLAGWRRAMGIPWMTKLELTQAIPPAYTEWIGRAILPTLEAP